MERSRLSLPAGGRPRVPACDGFAFQRGGDSPIQLGGGFAYHPGGGLAFQPGRGLRLSPVADSDINGVRARLPSLVVIPRCSRAHPAYQPDSLGYQPAPGFASQFVVAFVLRIEYQPAPGFVQSFSQPARLQASLFIGDDSSRTNPGRRNRPSSTPSPEASP